MARQAAADEIRKWRWLFFVGFVLYIKQKGNNWKTFIYVISLELKDICWHGSPANWKFFFSAVSNCQI